MSDWWNQRSRFSLLVMLLAVVYGIGIMDSVAGFLGYQYLDPALWPPATLPLFIFIFTLGFFSALSLGRGKRYGVYGLLLTWLLTGTVNLLFGPPYPAYGLTLAGVTVVLLFVWFLLPVWPELE